MTECSAGRRLDEELWARESGLCRLDDGAAGDGRSIQRAPRPAVTPENFFSPDTHWE